MNDTLEFPPIAESAAPLAIAETKQATLKETALASFAPIVAHMTTLAQRYRNVAFDLLTPKGMAAAKSARLELREEGRYAVQRLQKRLKDEANDLKRTIDAKAEEAISIVKPVEDAIHEQIEARETQIAAEKAERERIEAERVHRHQEGISRIRAYLLLAQQPGMTAERIAKGMDMLRVATFGPEWEEFAVPAANAQCETIEAMQRLHADAVAREEAAARATEEAARLEAQRLENERIASEQAAESARLAAIAADLKRQADELAAQQAAAAEAKRLADEEIEAARQRASAPEVTPLALRCPPPLAHLAPLPELGAAGTPGAGSAEAAPVEEPDTFVQALIQEIDAACGPNAWVDRQVAQNTTSGAAPQQASDHVSPEAEAAPGGTEDHFPDAEEMVLRTDLPQPVADPVAAADIQTRVILALPEDEDDEGGIDANDLHMRCLAFVRRFMALRDGKFPSHPKPGPDWFATMYADGDALLPRLAATTGSN